MSFILGVWASFNSPDALAVVAYFVLVFWGAMFSLAERKGKPSMWHIPKSKLKRWALASMVPAIILAFSNRPDKIWIVVLVLAFLACLGYGLSDYLLKPTRNIAAFLLCFSLGSLVIGLGALHAWPMPEVPTIPKLEGFIDESVTAYTPELKARQLFIRVSITNTGAVPTAVTNYGIHLPASCLGRAIDQGSEYIPDGMTAKIPSRGTTAVFHKEDALYEKTAGTNMVPVGGEVVGWLRFVFPGSESETEKLHMCSFKLSFVDAWKTTYYSPFIPGSGNEPTYVPGVNQPFK